MRWSLLALLPLITSLDGTHAATQSRQEVPSPDHVVVSFKRIQLTDKFWSDGVAVADINRVQYSRQHTNIGLRSRGDKRVPRAGAGARSAWVRRRRNSVFCR